MDIKEEEYVKIANVIRVESNELLESREIALSKVQLGVSRTFGFYRDYGVLVTTNLNRLFEKTKDIIKFKVVTIDPVLEFEFLIC